MIYGKEASTQENMSRLGGAGASALTQPPQQKILDIIIENIVNEIGEIATIQEKINQITHRILDARPQAQDSPRNSPVPESSTIEGKLNSIHRNLVSIRQAAAETAIFLNSAA